MYYIILGILVALVVSCSGKKTKDGEDGSVTLEFWSLTDELKPVIAHYEKLNPNIKINLTIIPNENYPAKIMPVLRSGKGAPDIFVGEAAYVRRWVDTPFWLNLSKNFKLNTEKLSPYTVDIGRDSKGDVRALSWQATPGGTFVRRSYAKKYFGTDNPQELSEQIFSSTDKILKAARSLKEQSNGEMFMFASVSDLFAPAKGRRTKPWVVDGKLNIDPSMLDLYKMAKIMYDEDLLAKAEQWTPAWFNGMKQEGNVLAYLLPTWGLHYVLKANAPDSSGDWVLTNFYTPWFWGGTWLGIYAKSEKKEAAWDFVSAMTQDNEFMSWWGKKSGDFLSNKEATASLKEDFKEEYLGGQNHYKFFASQVNTIQANLTKYDQKIDGFFQQSLDEYLEDRVATVEEALTFFRNEVKTAYPEIKVE